MVISPRVRWWIEFTFEFCRWPWVRAKRTLPFSFFMTVAGMGSGCAWRTFTLLPLGFRSWRKWAPFHLNLVGINSDSNNKVWQKIGVWWKLWSSEECPMTVLFFKCNLLFFSIVCHNCNFVCLFCFFLALVFFCFCFYLFPLIIIRR